MLPIVARSASPSVARPGPKNSTNLPTTPRSRSISVTVSTRSVAVAPSGSEPRSLKPTTSGRSIGIRGPGGRRALRRGAAQLEPPGLGDEHRHRLAEHRRLGLDPADAPAQHAEPVD